LQGSVNQTVDKNSGMCCGSRSSDCLFPQRKVRSQTALKSSCCICHNHLDAISISNNRFAVVALFSSIKIMLHRLWTMMDQDLSMVWFAFFSEGTLPGVCSNFKKQSVWTSPTTKLLLCILLHFCVC